MKPFEKLTKERSQLGESPLWDDKKKLLYYLDIDGKKQYTYEWQTKTLQMEALPQKTGCIALCEDGSLLYAMEDGIYQKQGDHFVLAHAPMCVAGERFNDGAVAPDGSFLVGTMSKSGRGKLYRLYRGGIEVIFDDVMTSNGIDFSPDGKTMYYIDTPTLKVVAYDYPSIQNERLVLDVPEFFGMPDGLCVDAAGEIYVGLYAGSGLLHLRDGDLFAEKIDVPAKNTTCPAFCGPELDCLCVTSAMSESATDHDGGCTFLSASAGKGKKVWRYHP